MSLMTRMAESEGVWRSAEAAGLLSLWEARRPAGWLPHFEDIGFKALDPWLDRIVLIRTDFRAQDFRFHFVGERAERHFGGNVTGASAMSVLSGPDYLSLMRYLDAVRTKGRPIHSVVPVGAGASAVGTLERLFLPCAEGNAVSAVILFLQAGDGDLPSGYTVL